MLLALLWACPHAGDAVPAGARPLLLWRVDGAKGVPPSWLFGTCHLPIPLEHALPPPHTLALEQARVVLTEVRLDGLDPVAVLAQMHPDRSLRSRLGDVDFARFAGHFGAEMPGPLLDRMPAWAAYAMWMAPGVGTGAGAEPPAILDEQVQEAAERHGVPQEQLETLEAQLEVLQRHDDVFADAIRGAMSAPFDPGQSMREACALTDPARVASAVEAFGTGPTSRDLLADRTRSWMPRLEGELRRGGAFVAVGAGHLVGEEGLVALLRAEGYRVAAQSAPAASARVALPGAEPPAPSWPDAPTPEAVATWTRSISEAAGPAFCAGPDALGRRLGLTEEACRANVAAAAEVCALQRASTLAPDGDLEALPLERRVLVIGCGGADLVYQLVLSGDLPLGAP